MKPTLIITAAQERLVNTDDLGNSPLYRAVEYYIPLDWRIIVALPVGISKIFSSQETEENFSNIQLLEVPKDMAGALATAVFAISKAQLSEGPIFIAAGDTFFTDSSVLVAMQEIAVSELEAGLVVFDATDPRYSYLALAETGEVRLVTEKKVSGRFATTGIFFFASSLEFKNASQWCFVNKVTHEGKFYVSGAVNYFLLLGKNVGYKQVQSECIRKSWG